MEVKTSQTADVRRKGIGTALSDLMEGAGKHINSAVEGVHGFFNPPKAPEPDMLHKLLSDRRVRLGAAGVAGGAGIASVLNLLHELELEKKRRAMAKDIGRTDENTIVLTLPRKQGAVIGSADEPTTVKKIERASSSTTAVPAKTYRVGHYGTQQMKVAELPGYVQWALGGLALGGGGAAGYSLADALYQARLKRKLKVEEDWARKEMLDMLSNPGLKTGGWLDNVIDVEKIAEITGTKEAADRLDAVLGVPTLLYLLGTGGTAYLTKRILDQQVDEQDSEGLQMPKVRRIVFRSAPEDEDPELKQASAEDLGITQAALFIMMDKLRGQTRILNQPSVKTALDNAGLTIRGLYKCADTGADAIVNAIQGDPAAWQATVNKGLELPGARTLNVMGFPINVPRGVTNFAYRNIPLARESIDARVREGLVNTINTGGTDMSGTALRGRRRLMEANRAAASKPFDWQAFLRSIWGKISGFASGLGRRFLGTGQPGAAPPTPLQATRDTVKPQAGMRKEFSAKYAALTMPILSSFIGSTLASKAGEPPEKRTWEGLPERSDLARVLRGIDIDAEDPEAAAYVHDKRARIRKLLEQLVADGKI
jgi:hypothetical protein